MTGPADAVRLGALALGFWLGRPEVTQDPAALIRDLNQDLAGKLDELGRRLYHGPGENIVAPPEQFLVTPADDLYLELSREIGLSPRPFWPGASPYAVCLTHDVDRISGRFHLAREEWRQGRPSRAARICFLPPAPAEDPFRNFEHISVRETAWGVRSAIYVLFERRRWLKALCLGEPQHVLGVYNPREIGAELRRLDQLGFEIGLHGSLEAHAAPAALSRELGRLGDLLDRPGRAFGVRNHYLQFLGGVTPAIQIEAGVLYDSSLGFNFSCGFSCGTAFPFPLWGRDGAWLPELPLNVMDTALSFAAPGREKMVADRILAEVRRRGGLLMINWHQRFCNPATGPIMLGWVEETLDRARKDGAWLALPAQAAAFYRDRLSYGA